MGDKSKIEWTDATWNPVVGCSKVSEGCENCYAIRVAYRNAAMGSARYQGLTEKQGNQLNWTGEVRIVPEILERPLHWKKPRRIFVNSMSDLFHEDVPIDFIYSVFTIMLLAEKHTFQILTKRPEIMIKFCKSIMKPTAPNGFEKPADNVWLGVSVEDQRTANERIPVLLRTPASKRWISMEPLLGHIDLQEVNELLIRTGCLGGIDWIVVGGESGPCARPMEIEWVRSMKSQYEEAGIAFFMKQGSQANWSDFKNYESFPEDIRVRQFPSIIEPSNIHSII